jgi:ammonium transporter, Amt family
MEQQVTELAYALDTFYFLVSGALVMWMAAGFTMLEAGMVRTKSVAEILTKNIALYSIASIMFMVVGYNIMYGEGLSTIIPSIGAFISGDNSVEDVMASGGDIYYSARADFFFQVVFVATAMSIISGAVAERMKLWAFLAFAVVMTGFIYPIQGFWSWGGGFLSELGYVDYAGSGIVHFTGAVAALAGVILLGARKGKYGPNGEINAIPGSAMPLATLGVLILWLGWFGFNGGSELKVSDISSANNVAAVFANTNLAAAGGVLGALITTRLLFGKADLTMALNGAIAGLVAITADPLSPYPLLAAVIGAIGGVIVVFSIVGLDKLRIDDRSARSPPMAPWVSLG